MKQKHIVTKQLSFLIAMILVCLQLLPIGAFAVGQAQPQEEMMQAQAASTKKYRSPFIAKGYTSGAYYKQPGSSWSAGYHTGQDYNCSNDTLVAPASGTIQRSRWDNSYGNYIVIATNDGWVILMAHMASTPLVKEGQKVTAGQRVGTMGSTGNVTGKHLHLEIESSGTWAYNKNLQDPRQYILIWITTAAPPPAGATFIKTAPQKNMFTAPGAPATHRAAIISDILIPMKLRMSTAPTTAYILLFTTLDPPKRPDL